MNVFLRVYLLLLLKPLLLPHLAGVGGRDGGILWFCALGWRTRTRRASWGKRVVRAEAQRCGGDTARGCNLKGFVKRALVEWFQPNPARRGRLYQENISFGFPNGASLTAASLCLSAPVSGFYFPFYYFWNDTVILENVSRTNLKIYKADCLVNFSKSIKEIAGYLQVIKGFQCWINISEKNLKPCTVLKYNWKLNV